jgi:hypothetical protein
VSVDVGHRGEIADQADVLTARRALISSPSVRIVTTGITDALAELVALATDA